MSLVILKAGREKLALNRHPWVFSGAVAQVVGNPQPGEVVEVQTADRKFVAWGQYNPASKIRLRLMEWREAVRVDEAWYEQRWEEALALRSPWRGSTQALRLAFAEADGLPGLIVDQIGDWLVLQFLTSGAERQKAFWTALLARKLPFIKGIVEKSDGDGRRMEGLEDAYGVLWGEAPPQRIRLQEAGAWFEVEWGAQKTGFYSDQRDNRLAVAQVASGKRVLDAFCYTGGFAVHALRAGASSAVLLDASQEALAMAQHNVELNGFSVERCVEGDAFTTLRTLKKDHEKFGLVVLDPPKLAPTRESLPRALRGYKDLNLQALALVEEGGWLASFSCSGAVDPATFEEVIAYAAKDAGRTVQIVRHLWQAPCHPVRTSMPESAYLKGILARVL